ncbi:hsp70 nucleotide exchange factor fes1 [Oleoguttula sp. CCFEE 5521]
MSQFNELLQWGIENSAGDQPQATNGAPRNPRSLNPELLAQLLGGPSDADRMRDAMLAITAPSDKVDLENKLIAWDNFEQLIENLDNANNMQALGLWMPLVEQLGSGEAESVQNNAPCQERCLAIGAVPKLLKLALEDKEQSVRKKAVTALSSEVRNYQPGLDELAKHTPKDIWAGNEKLDAGEMEQVDKIIGPLREKAAKP